MQIPSSEDLDRAGNVRLVRHERPPISIVLGVISYVAGVWWVNELEPTAKVSHLSIELSWGWLLFGVALIVGTLYGVRTAWALLSAGSVILTAFLLVGVVDSASAQAIGGFVFSTVALVCLQLPSSQRFEHRRLRLVLD